MPSATDWPLLLAGPIVRRVEPSFASVWVALKEPRAVRLSVFNAPIDTGPGDTLFDEPTAVMSKVTRTVRVGENLHIAVAEAAPAPEDVLEDPLLPGHIYAYNVAFGPHDNETFSATEDLRSLLLLRDHRPVEPPPPDPPPEEPPPDTTPFVPPHLALGYEPGLLPTFVLPPDELTDLRIVHASCRRASSPEPDMLAGLDEVIESGRIDARARPQQLFLTGDQIYSDNVAPAHLHICTSVGNELMGTVERLPITWTPPGHTPTLSRLPADHTHFPAGARKAVVVEDARLTTEEGESHLLSLGEYCAMYILCWNNALWPKKLPTYAQLYWEDPLPIDEFDAVLSGVEPPAPIWQLHLGLYEKSRHGLKELCADTRDLDHFSAQNAGQVFKCIAEDEESKERYEKETENNPGTVKSFRDGLPKVRRALANVATYMIVDDHEVTDDLNVSPAWRDRVFTSPLGRTVLRNGFLAYLVFQAWGNDPAATTADLPATDEEPVRPSPLKRLLHELVPQIFPTGQDPPTDRATLNELDQLLGLDGGEPSVRWHYSIDGPRHRVLVLDIRTRRSFRSRNGPPVLISTKSLQEQIPDIRESPLPAGIEVLFVVSPVPLLAVPLFDEFAGPLLVRGFNIGRYRNLSRLPGTHPDKEEWWSANPAVLEEVLARLAPYRRVVVLSGDVHYGHSSELSYWLRGEKTPARFAQFTSSGVKNIDPETVAILNRDFAFFETLVDLFSPVVRHGWHSSRPPPLEFPEGHDPSPGIRLALATEPVLLPGITWPLGTRVAIRPDEEDEPPPDDEADPSDWAWRLTLVADQRPHNELPSAAKPASLDPEDPTADVTETLEGYRRAARRHAQQLEKVSHRRRLLFASNYGMITFARGDEGRLTAKQELFAGSKRPSAFTVHEIALDVPEESMPAIEVEQPDS